MAEFARLGWWGLLMAATQVAQAMEPVQLASLPQDLDMSDLPRARMVDETTCEIISGAKRRGTRNPPQLVPHAWLALYRKGSSRMPFMRVQSGDNGLFAVRFPATPGDVIRVRAYVADPKTGEVRYGDGKTMTCIKATVSVGEVLPESSGGKSHPATE